MNETDMLFNRAALAGITVHLLEWLKKNNRVPLISQASDKLNVGISAFLALLVTAGFVYNWTGDLLSGGVLSIHIPPADKWIPVIGTFVLNWSGQFVAQRTYYQAAVKKPRENTIGMETWNPGLNTPEDDGDWDRLKGSRT